MLPQKLLALAAMLSMPLAASAARPDPADPDAPATPFVYQPAFAGYRSSPADDAQAPDAGWRAANDEAGRLRGHQGQMGDAPPAGGITVKPLPAGAEPERPPSSGHRHHH